MIQKRSLLEPVLKKDIIKRKQKNITNGNKPFIADIWQAVAIEYRTDWTCYNGRRFDPKEIKIKIEAVKINWSCYLFTLVCVRIYTCKLSELASILRTPGKSFNYVRIVSFVFLTALTFIMTMNRSRTIFEPISNVKWNLKNFGRTRELRKLI